jgi:hypothetical protein
MKIKKINRKMLVSTLAVLSLLLVTGYTLVVAQSKKDIDIDPLSEVRTGNAIGKTTDIEVTYLNLETTNQIPDDSSDGDNVECSIWSWLVVCSTYESAPTACHGTCYGISCDSPCIGPGPFGPVKPLPPYQPVDPTKPPFGWTVFHEHCPEEALP